MVFHRTRDHLGIVGERCRDQNNELERRRYRWQEWMEIDSTVVIPSATTKANTPESVDSQYCSFLPECQLVRPLMCKEVFAQMACSRKTQLMAAALGKAAYCWSAVLIVSCPGWCRCCSVGSACAMYQVQRLTTSPLFSLVAAKASA